MTTNSTSKNEMIEEALKRMKLLDLSESIITQFKDNSTLYCSTNCSFPAPFNSIVTVNLVPLEESIQEKIKRFEKEYQGVVFHVIKSESRIGLHYSFLYVCKNTEEWNLDLEDIKDNTPLTWTENITDPDCSEFGQIGVHKINGGLIRCS